MASHLKEEYFKKGLEKDGCVAYRSRSAQLLLRSRDKLTYLACVQPKTKDGAPVGIWSLPDGSFQVQFNKAHGQRLQYVLTSLCNEDQSKAIVLQLNHQGKFMPINAINCVNPLDSVLVEYDASNGSSAMILSKVVDTKGEGLTFQEDSKQEPAKKKNMKISIAAFPVVGASKEIKAAFADAVWVVEDTFVLRTWKKKIPPPSYWSMPRGELGNESNFARPAVMGFGHSSVDPRPHYGLTSRDYHSSRLQYALESETANELSLTSRSESPTVYRSFGLPTQSDTPSTPNRAGQGFLNASMPVNSAFENQGFSLGVSGQSSAPSAATFGGQGFLNSTLPFHSTFGNQGSSFANAAGPFSAQGSFGVDSHAPVFGVDSHTPVFGGFSSSGPSTFKSIGPAVSRDEPSDVIPDGALGEEVGLIKEDNDPIDDEVWARIVPDHSKGELSATRKRKGSASRSAVTTTAVAGATLHTNPMSMEESDRDALMMSHIAEIKRGEVGVVNAHKVDLEADETLVVMAEFGISLSNPKREIQFFDLDTVIQQDMETNMIKDYSTGTKAKLLEDKHVFQSTVCCVCQEPDADITKFVVTLACGHSAVHRDCLPPEVRICYICRGRVTAIL